ncbi:metallophosphoesterase [Candidatus Methylospira mobilis]|uniref:Metallophosphoesterase n=1 Tax=Candidatus Methylospira mobilis TaxID=1808979 RepID=A0A5Q0BH81_9GAMM|nr:metallophosphoesterase [Candidatus Methylospira mobilis]QFY42492.1 metallophosphoesterase [Candidatus Methylospira mobilis]
MIKVKRIVENTAGRDFIVGDLHGAFDLLDAAMEAVDFDARKDRLFSVGDLVDRGPDSPRVIAFLEQPFFFAVRGNHEDMFLDIYAESDTPSESVVREKTANYGMRWWWDLPQNERLAYIAAFRRLPLVMEVQTRHGAIGILHAEVPLGMDWATFTALIESGDQQVIQQALRGRSRACRGDNLGVDGIERVFVGHTPLESAAQRGNVFHLDTGAVFGLMDPDNSGGRLTFAGLNSHRVLMASPVRKDLIDIHVEPGQS